MIPLRSQRSPLKGLLAHVYSSDFLDNINTGICVHDSSGAIIDCNVVAAELLGVPVADLVGRMPLDERLSSVCEDGTKFPPLDHPALRTVRTGLGCRDVVMGLDIPGRARRWISIDTYPIAEDGELLGAISAFDDISVQQLEHHSLKLLTEVNRFVMATEGESESLQSLCSALVELGPYALACIAVKSREVDGSIEFIHAAGVTGYLYEGMASWSGEREIGRGPIGTAMRTGATQTMNDLANHPLFEPWRDRAAAFGLNSCVAIPFAPGGRMAVLVVYDHHVYAFEDATVRGLEEIAREVEFGALHLISMRQVEAALDGTISALGHITETRDPYTAGHQSNVGLLAAAIGRHLGLEPRMLKLIMLSGQVHDIGKTAVPAEILSRPRRLSALEYELVRRHSEIGSEILSRASLPWPIADVALRHHERMDGSGYPSGLKGGEIILPARIVAVADVVEAMTHHRPYRHELGLERALAEVTAGSGTLFDADVVRSCLAVFADGFHFESSLGRDSH
jgi:HD-GYP domain-containing protein (c-di-GMP phosphodiesterase class II)